VKLKTAVDPVKLTVVTTFPFLRRVTEVIPEAGGPVSVRVRLFKLTLVEPGLFS